MAYNNGYTELKSILQSLNLPKGEILYLHVQLKEIFDNYDNYSYKDLACSLLTCLDDLFQPKAVLVPAFTYSFTKTYIYDRVNTAGEVGRFGEEVRKSFSYKNRTINPVFSVIDVHDYFMHSAINEETAFGHNSLHQNLHNIGHIVVNINTPKLISTYFHYLEAHCNVDYRFSKIFTGKISPDGVSFNDIKYEYYVRNLDIDTKWRRYKIERFLRNAKVLHVGDINGVRLNWFNSKEANITLGERLNKEPRFMVTD